MRYGRHFVQFTVMDGDAMVLGVIRPGWNVEGGLSAYKTWRTATASTIYASNGGHCWPLLATASTQRLKALDLSLICPPEALTVTI